MNAVNIAPFLKQLLPAVVVVIGLCCIASLVYGIKAKRFTDKLVAANMITSLSMNAICVLAILANEDYILDVALIYAVLGFAAIAVLCKLYTEKNKKEDGEE